MSDDRQDHPDREKDDRTESFMWKKGEQAGDRAAEGTTPPGSLAGAAEDSFWRSRYAEQPYTDADRGYDYYRPAFRYGWEARDRLGDRDFDEVEAELRKGWEPSTRGLSWEDARPAVRDAFRRPSGPGWSEPGNPLA